MSNNKCNSFKEYIDIAQFFPSFLAHCVYTSKEYSRVTNCSHLRAPKTINFALQSFEAW